MTTIVWAGAALLDANEPLQIEHGVAVEGNRVIATGPLAALRRDYPAANEIGDTGLLLLPAFVNSHDHGRGLGSASLGVGDDLLEIWLPGLWAQPPLDPYLAAAFDGLRLLRSGVGTVAHSHNPRDWANMADEAAATLRGYRDAGIRVVFFPPMVDQNRLVYDDEDGFLASLPPDLRPLAPQFGALPPLSHNDYFALCDTLMREYHDPEGYTAQIQVSPVGGQWCSDELIGRCIDWARSHHTRVQMHLLETRYQRHYARRRWNTSFVQHLDAIGALGPWLSCAHMVWVEREDLPLLAERGVAVAHNPSSNLRLRSGVAPLAAMLDAGVTLGVGLDGHGLDDNQDYLRELRLAWTLAQQPGAGASAPTIDAATIWRLGTRGGAAATLGPDAPLGCLAPGMLADLVLIDLEQLVYDPLLAPEQLLETVLRLASHQQVRDVMVHGRWVVRAGRTQLLDEATITQAVRDDLRRAKRVPDAGAAAQALAPYIRRFYAHWDEA